MLEILLAAAVSGCTSVAAPLIAAHRGGRDSAHPENTLPAFHHAAAVGARIIELDVRASRDGEPVVIHDKRVNRTTDGRGLVHELDADTITGLDAGNGTRVPTLNAVLDDLAPLDVELLLDIKPAPGLDHAAVARAVRNRFPAERVIFGVRSLEDRRALAQPGDPARFLGLVPGPRSIDDFLAAGVEAIRLWPGWLRREPALIDHVRSAGARVWVTAGDAADAALIELRDLGVDVLLTDRPAAAVAAVGCR